MTSPSGAGATIRQAAPLPRWTSWAEELLGTWGPLLSAGAWQSGPGDVSPAGALSGRPREPRGAGVRVMLCPASPVQPRGLWGMAEVRSESSRDRAPATCQPGARACS